MGHSSSKLASMREKIVKEDFVYCDDVHYALMDMGIHPDDILYYNPSTIAEVAADVQRFLNNKELKLYTSAISNKERKEWSATVNEMLQLFNTYLHGDGAKFDKEVVYSEKRYGIMIAHISVRIETMLTDRLTGILKRKQELRRTLVTTKCFSGALK